MKLHNRILAALFLLLASPAFAGTSSSSSASAASVPELDGSMAFIALALTAGVIALIKERRRR